MKPTKHLVYFFLFFGLSVFAQKATISEVIIQGAHKTSHNLIRSLISTKSGIVLDSTAIAKDVTLLKRLPAFNHVYYQVIADKNQEYIVKIGVDENFTIIPDINVWTTTNDVFSYKLGLYDYNFLGKNIAFGGFYQYNGFDSYGINFRAPNLFSKKWGLAVNHQNWKSEEPLFFGNQTANYLYNNISYEALALYQINLQHEIDFGINYFSEKYLYLSGDTSPEVPLDLDLDKTLLKFVYSYNNLKYYYQYVNGFKSKLYVQYVTTTNDFQNDFLIAWNDFFYYKRLGKKGNFANRLRLGLASNEDSPFAPFALDNNLNLRGVGILVDRGTGVVVLNSEYRHTVYDKKWLAIQTNVFTDLGSWRNPGGELSDIIQGENVRAFAGLGVRVISKKVYNATFRIDYGFSLVNKFNGSRGGLVFGVGQYF
ncbi:outer membrane protein assembly factor [Polaribacter sp. WD7]|uniref:POTRA domain-containing protein n=1 Tax=Polaribacter sp. WD7 TaxID=2269061 RepID=UPI000DF29B30|nr:POTRA domain-containing protein [Polaribacter sp. WD7]RCS27957.1 outer membrane protein assembly factor [Polaribacter sp. WD7]